MEIKLYTKKDSALIDKCIELARKYDKNYNIPIIVQDQSKIDYYYISFEVDSLEDIKDLKKDIAPLNDSPSYEITLNII